MRDALEVIGFLMPAALAVRNESEEAQSRARRFGNRDEEIGLKGEKDRNLEASFNHFAEENVFWSHLIGLGVRRRSGQWRSRYVRSCSRFYWSGSSVREEEC